MALENNFTKIIIEGDSQSLFSVLSKIMQGTKFAEITSNWRLTYGLEELEHLLPRFSTTVPSHIKRNDNRLADRLANIGIDNEGIETKADDLGLSFLP